MTSLVNKSGDWTPNYHKILIFSPLKSLKSLRTARIDELADSNEPAINQSKSGKHNMHHMSWCIQVTPNLAGVARQWSLGAQGLATVSTKLACYIVAHVNGHPHGHHSHRPR